jgi:half-pint family poly-U binding splicing factor
VPQAAQTGSLLYGPGAKKAGFFELPTLTSYQEECLRKAKKYAMEQNVRTVMVKQTIAQQQQQQQKQQAMALMYRSLEQIWTKLGTIYVGSINFDIREDTVKQAFLPFGPMKSINLAFDHLANKHKGFAFIEYDIPEAAFLAIEQMHNVMLGGRNIKVGRPTNMPQCKHVIERLLEESSQYHRIYVTSIHPDLTEKDLQTVFEAFGKIVSIKLAPDMFRPGKHRGYAFIQYEDQHSADEAMVAMNLFDLGGQYLRVGRAVTPPNMPQFIQSVPSPIPTAAAVAAAAVSAQLSAFDAGVQPIVSPPGVAVPQMLGAVRAALPLPGVVIPQTLGARPLLSAPGVVIPQLSHSAANTESTSKSVEDEPSLEQQENLQIKGSQARNIMMQKLLRKSESHIMVLKNMVGPEDLDEDLEEEVTDECGKYGPVNKVIIYQEKQSEDDNAEIVIKIFVDFVNTTDAEKAIKALNNRFFAGRRVHAHLYDQQLYDNNDLSG